MNRNFKTIWAREFVLEFMSSSRLKAFGSIPRNAKRKKQTTKALHLRIPYIHKLNNIPKVLGGSTSGTLNSNILFFSMLRIPARSLQNLFTLPPKVFPKLLKQLYPNITPKYCTTVCFKSMSPPPDDL